MTTDTALAAGEGTTVNPRPLAVLARQINAAHHACLAAAQASLQHAVEAGRLLSEAKARCRHGKWLRWGGENCQFSERTAQVYMRVYERFSALPEVNAQRAAHLSLRAFCESEHLGRGQAGPEPEVDRLIHDLEKCFRLAEG